MGLKTCWRPDWNAVRMAVIPNTLEVADLWVSAALLDEARRSATLKVQGELQPLPFDADGTLMQEALFPHCARARHRGVG